MPIRTSYRSGVPCWIDLVSPRSAVSQAFYGTLFGWTFERERPGYLLARVAGGVVGAVAAAPDPQQTHAAWTTYLAADLDDALPRVTAGGGRTVVGPVPVGAGRLALAVDGIGAAVGFWEGHRADGIVVTDEPGALAGHTLHSPDPRATGDWYVGVFPDTVTCPDATTYAVGGVRYADIVTMPTPQWIPRFLSTDVDASTALAVRLGATVTVPGAVPVLADPVGGAFALVAR